MGFNMIVNSQFIYSLLFTVIHRNEINIFIFLWNKSLYNIFFPFVSSDNINTIDNKGFLQIDLHYFTLAGCFKIYNVIATNCAIPYIKLYMEVILQYVPPVS